MSIACRLSKLPIEEEDLVLFIPLKHYKYRNNVLNFPLISPTDDFVPFTLPIEGEFGYNDMYNIKKDINTDIIEKKYNLSIEQFISLVNCSRKVTDTFSVAYELFASNHSKNILDRFYKDNRLQLFDFGFNIEVDDDSVEFTHNLVPNIIFTIIDENFVYAKNKNSETVFKCQFMLDVILNELMDKLNINLVVDEKHIKTFNELSNLTGMFIRKDVYQKFIVENPQHVDFLNKEWETLKKDFLVRKKVIADINVTIPNKLSIEKSRFLIDSFVSQSPVMYEFKTMDNLFIYFDYLNDDMLKNHFQEFLTLTAFLYQFSISYYPNQSFREFNNKMLEFEEFKLKKIKEYLIEEDELID